MRASRVRNSKVHDQICHGVRTEKERDSVMFWQLVFQPFLTRKNKSTIKKWARRFIQTNLLSC